MNFFRLLVIILTVGLYGCVGVVQETTPAYTEANDAPERVLTFAGIHSATAISDSRAEVFFYPANGGTGKYTYDVMVGSNPFPVHYPADILTPDYRGLLKVTLTDLTVASNYQIRVEVRDNGQMQQSNSGEFRTIQTFDNLVARFNGISSVYNTSGQDGKDSIKVRWTPAQVSGGLSAQEWDPKAYEIVLVDAEKLTPADMDLPYSENEGRWAFQILHSNTKNEHIIRGLPSQTKFYVRMRAIHTASIEDAYDPKKRSELNTSYATISTLSASLADIAFKPDSFELALANGEQGLNSIQATWAPAQGVFDHYRLYYGIGGVDNNLPDLCLPEILSAPGSTVFCKKVKFDINSTPVTGLAPYTEYQIKLVLCATATCGPDERILAPTRTLSTDPSSPFFGGVREVTVINNLQNAGDVIVDFEIPDFSTGYFDGLILQMRRTLDGSDVPVEITTDSSVYHLSYDFTKDNKIVVKGLSLLETEPVCFTLFPFKYDSANNRRETPNDIWKCVALKAEGPTAREFPGLKDGFSAADVIYLSWEEPTNGLYSHYELFWRKQSGLPFNWGTAIAEAGNDFNFTNYGRVLIDDGELDITLEGFPDGQYTFGMVTYLKYLTDSQEVVIRSSNSEIMTCTVDHSVTADPILCHK